MKRIAMLASLIAGTASAYAQQADTTVVHLQEAQVTATRANSKTPVAFSTLGRTAIQRTNVGQDVPFLLSTLPSITTTSDAGNAIGYTGIRVRGTDPTRINVTANGIPINDSESHGVFWVNMGDFASSLSSIQVQRGVGTSTNGAAAFGATIDLQTEGIPATPFLELATSAGSFATSKHTIEFGSGTFAKHWAASGRLSRILSDGYRDRASAHLLSYMAQVGYFNAGTTLKFIAFGGGEKTYHAWDGISREQLRTNRTYNPNGRIKHSDGSISYYDNQNDVYRQFHHHLTLHQVLTDALTLHAGLHYTKGHGYYEEYKQGAKYANYGMANNMVAGTEQKRGDLIRRKYLDNDFYGGVFSLNYKQDALDATLGGALNRYSGDHYGRVLNAIGYTLTNDPNRRYYDHVGRKTDGNIYARATYTLDNGFGAYADLQYRHLHYTIDGTSDKRSTEVMKYNLNYHFFNPKVGINYQINPNHRLYASVAIARREPTHDGIVEGYLNRVARPERLTDYELGYQLTLPRFSFGANLYYMDYKNQFVLTGQLNEIGEAVQENVAKSYRMGIELTAAAQIAKWLTWEANATLSANKIKDYTAYFADDATWETLKGFHLGKRTIAMSPAVVTNNRFTATLGHLSASLTTQYVSRQYLDNTQQRANSLDAYCVSHLGMEYKLPIKIAKDCAVGFTMYNLFNTKYETNGYAYSSYNADDTLNNVAMFYPMAGRNFLAHLRVRF